MLLLFLLLRFRNIGTARMFIVQLSLHRNNSQLRDSQSPVSRDSYLFKCEYFRYISHNSSAAVDAW